MSLKCLVIGAGAVGAPYGRHLQAGGADVTYFVKEKYAASLKDGIKILHYNKKRRGIQNFTGFSIISSAKEAGAERWDQIYITISSTALRSDSFAELITAVNEDATVVLMQAGVEDFEYLAERHPRGNIVQNLITLSSYQAPLPGEDLEQCIAYWFPPGGSPVSGVKEKALPVVAALKAGKFPAKFTGNTDGVQRNTAYATGFFMPFLAALESNGWSFKKLRQSGDLKLVEAAAGQVHGIMAKKTGAKKPFGMSFLKSPVLKMALLAQSWVVPFNLEAFFKYHFLKVKDQTLFYIQGFIESGREYGLPVDQLQTLYDRVK